MSRSLPRAAALFAALVTIGAAVTATPASALELRVEVRDAQPGEGQVNAALFSGSDRWLRQPHAGQRVPAAAGSAATVLVWRDLPPGRYALSMFQDLNGNGRLDVNPAGMPVEPYGFSRDAAGRMGPPSFDDAAIELSGDTTIVVTLR